MDVKIDYYEFNKHEYYALMAVKKDQPYRDTYNKSVKLYVDIVAGESVAEVKKEGIPTQITRNQALLKWLTCKDNKDTNVGILIDDFNGCEDTVLLVDSTLV